MGAGAQGCLYHAGVVNADETLTKRAVDLFIEDVKKELLLGSDGYTPVFPCGPTIAPNPFAEQLDLENEKKFPDFHKQIIHGMYEKVAKQLNLAGGFTILPICDPFALAFALGIDLDLDIEFPDGFLDYLIPNLPKLAIDLDLMPPIKLAAKFPGLLKVPPSFPSFSVPPIPIPALNFNPGLNIDLQFALKFPKLLLNLVAQMPGLILDLPNLPSAICNIIFKSGLFSVIPEASLRIVAYKILVRKISEMMMIIVAGKVVGSSPVGVTGGMGSKLGYDPPVTKKNRKSKNPRDRMIAYAEKCVDLQWGNKSQHHDGGTVQDQYVQRLLYTEYGDGSRKDNLKKDDPLYDPRVIGKKKCIEKASNSSSCGTFVRACAAAGGAKYVFKYAGQPQLNKNPKVERYYDFFTDEYRLINGEGIAIEALLQAAKSKEAVVDKPRRDLPALKKGDIIIVYDPKHSGREHVMLISKDYNPGSFSLDTIEGGQPDDKNKGRPTAIIRKTYKSTKSSEFTKKKNRLDPPYGFEVTSGGTIKFSGREILSVIDGEKLCTSNTGASSSNPDKTIDPDFYDNNDPTADEKAGLLPVTG